ncbi:Arc family DNA-binding protein [Rhizobium bangladeshense]|uniref:Arc family DNA-binding protein n=1 Tax=Rhizobium bangladeshense TaxID=1138189 RepID=UPI001C82F0D4|nr:Arc family DNA-binding protein [Rhizobium bangladeshense]MBX4920960.1 Arc family DNA-binding protein [Rhizobium bangladeshense]
MSEYSPSRLLDKIIIRVPEGMRDRIRRVADSNNRSVNAELLVLLDRTYPDVTKLDEHLQDIAEIVAKLPAENRTDAWRSVFERLEALRNDTV